MTIDANSDDLILGVAGAGAMGRGIVQVAAAGGCKVLLYDTNADAAKEAVDFVGNMMNRNVEKGRMAEEDAQAAIANIEVVDSLVDFAHCQIVIEAVVENLEIKNVVFREIEAAVSDDTIIASNTSSHVLARVSRADRASSVPGKP